MKNQRQQAVPDVGGLLISAAIICGFIVAIVIDGIPYLWRELRPLIHKTMQ